MIFVGEALITLFGSEGPDAEELDLVGTNLVVEEVAAAVRVLVQRDRPCHEVKFGELAFRMRSPVAGRIVVRVEQPDLFSPEGESSARLTSWPSAGLVGTCY